MNNPVKIIQVQGTLANGELFKQICSDDLNIHSGNWEIAFSDLSLKFINCPIFEDIFEISSNLVNSYQITPRGLLKANTVLYTVKINSSVNGRDLISASPTKWFQVNCASDKLRLFVRPWEPSDTFTKLVKNAHCIMNVNVLLKRLN